MTTTGETRPPDPIDEVIDWVTACITPTTEEVADWHFTDQVLQNEWDRPLLRVLRFFTEPQPGTRRAQESAGEEVDLVEVLDLTVLNHLGEELAS